MIKFNFRSTSRVKTSRLARASRDADARMGRSRALTADLATVSLALFIVQSEAARDVAAGVKVLLVLSQRVVRAVGRGASRG
jgi:hypothetical protein